MAENSVKYLISVEIDEFKFDKYWFRAFYVTEVYLICKITSDSMYVCVCVYIYIYMDSNFSCKLVLLNVTDKESFY